MELLKEFEFSGAEISFVKNHYNVNVTKNRTTDRNKLYSEKVIEYMEKEEFFLFLMLKNIGVQYKKPMLT